LLPTCQVDKGAIPFIIGGANVMIPGMTSKGGILPELDANKCVAIRCEGKQTVIGIGILQRMLTSMGEKHNLNEF
jgi:PUA domain protein